MSKFYSSNAMSKVLICSSYHWRWKFSLSFHDCSIFWEHQCHDFLKITINNRFYEILKIQPLCYTKNDIPGHWQGIYISKVWLTTFQPDPQLQSGFFSMVLLGVCDAIYCLHCLISEATAAAMTVVFQQILC